jgi:uncharacterized protein (DUF58 family)
MAERVAGVGAGLAPPAGPPEGVGAGSVGARASTGATGRLRRSLVDRLGRARRWRPARPERRGDAAAGKPPAGKPRAEAVGTAGGISPVAEAPEQLVRRLQWTVLRPLAARLGGDERSLVRGFGLELSELREYQPGDDVRHIDWNTTARTDRPFVREAYAERALDAWLVLDVSGSVNWGTARCLKRDLATEFAAIVGLLLGRQGNRIGALLFDERPRALVPPGQGRAHLLRLLSCLRDEPRRVATAPTDLAAALASVRAFARRRSLVLVVSDFLVGDGWQGQLGPLARRHEVVAVRLRDPREGSLPDVGLVHVEDPETGAQMLVDTSDRRLRERFAAAAAAQDDRIRADLARCGVDVLPLSTDEEIVPTLVRFLTARKYRRARPGSLRRAG